MDANSSTSSSLFLTMPGVIYLIMLWEQMTSVVDIILCILWLNVTSISFHLKFHWVGTWFCNSEDTLCPLNFIYHCCALRYDSLVSYSDRPPHGQKSIIVLFLTHWCIQDIFRHWILLYINTSIQSLVHFFLHLLSK
jgi:hypothetical protein